MRCLHSSPALLGISALIALPSALAAERVQVVTSFSILADMVDNVGGEHIEATSLVGPDSDAHVYSPRPTDARSLAESDLVVFNGLQFEGWMERLIDASDYTGPLVVTTDGIDRVEVADDGHGHDEHEQDEHSDQEGHGHGGEDPHGWQNLALGRVYVTNIRDGLIEADPDNAEAYTANTERYINEIDATNAEIHELLGEIPAGTSVITGHDSFGHFARAYGLEFLSPQGLSTESEPSAANMARLIGVIREQYVQALFHENMTSPAMIDQLAEETGLPIAGTLYADALAAEGEASTWLGMMRHNARVLHDALAEPGHVDDDHGHEH